MTRIGNWEVFLFYERGQKNLETCSRCPVITQIIESHNTVRTLAGLMYVSRTKPGTHIVPHHGPTNMRLRVHLGITIPEGDCALRVGNEIRRWEEGKCLVFDDHFEHESWNYTKQPRVVLILDIWHPDLTNREIAFLEGLHRYAYYQARSLNRYWTANAEARESARKEYD
jgi:aspartyl/asparaginyl beta-hydroxylase (cupin superfamily)